MNFVDILGLLSKSECAVIREILECEKTHGTRRCALKYSNTFGSTPMGPDFDNKAFPTAYGPLDIDWWTDIRIFLIGRNPDIAYVTGKAIWRFGHWLLGEDLPDPSYVDDKEIAALHALDLGAWKFSDLWSPTFMQGECGEKPCN